MGKIKYKTYVIISTRQIPHILCVVMVLRDDQGHFIKAKTISTAGIPDPREAEAWALLQTISAS